MNATGPQCDRVAAALLGGALPRLVPVLSLALNVVTRPLGLDAAVAAWRAAGSSSRRRGAA